MPIVSTAVPPLRNVRSGGGQANRGDDDREAVVSRPAGLRLMPGAVRVHAAGGPDVLRWETVPSQEPGPGQVLLRHGAIGLNYIDVYHRAGLYPQTYPFTPGVEGAGTIEAVGVDVVGLKVGDRVVYALELGAYAETRLIAADRLVKLPEAISVPIAAAILLKGLTAQFLLRRTYRIASGDTILVHAAAGGVGLILCQWAKWLGATVIGTVSTPEKAELCRSNGCDHPVVTGTADFADAVRELTAGKGVPVVYDSVGRNTFAKSLGCLRPFGTMILFGQSSGAVDPIDPNILQRGSLYLTRPTLATYAADRPLFDEGARELFARVGAGDVKVTINQTTPLSEAAEAHRRLEARLTSGSTVLVP